MKIKYTTDNIRYQCMTTEELRGAFMLQTLFEPGVAYSEVGVRKIGGQGNITVDGVVRDMDYVEVGDVR